MKINVLHLLPLLALFNFACKGSSNIQENKELDTLELADIAGTWECVYSVFDDPDLFLDEAPPYILQTPATLLFEGDSMIYFNFPCELVARRKVAIDNGRIYRPERETAQEGSSIWLANDTLFVLFGKHGDYYEEQRYVRTYRDTTTLNLLRRKPVNPECLLGTWDLVRDYDSGHDGHGVVDYVFPFEVENSIVLDSHEIALRLVEGWKFIMMADGEMRQFDVMYLSETGDELSLKTQATWYPDEQASNYYSGYTFNFRKRVQE